MEKLPEDFLFGAPTVHEDAYLTGPFSAERAAKGIDPRVGSGLPHSWRYLIRKAEALYDLVENLWTRVKRRRHI